MRTSSVMRLGQSFHDECLVNVGNNTTTSDCRFDERIEFFVTANSQLKVARSDALYLKVFASVTGQLKDLSSEIFKNSSRINSSSSTDARACIYTCLKISVDSTHGELTKRLVNTKVEIFTQANTYLKASTA